MTCFEKSLAVSRNGTHNFLPIKLKKWEGASGPEVEDTFYKVNSYQMSNSNERKVKQ